MGFILAENFPHSSRIDLSIVVGVGVIFTDISKAFDLFMINYVEAYG